jgi:hypothetical protein
MEPQNKWRSEYFSSVVIIWGGGGTPFRNSAGNNQLPETTIS